MKIPVKLKTPDSCPKIGVHYKLQDILSYMNIK